MKYLTDTDVFIDHLKGKQRIDEHFVKEGLGISIISYGELLYGSYKSSSYEKTLHIITAALHDLAIAIIPLTDESMHIFAKTKVQLEAKGVRLDDFDLLIAATAFHLSLQLITGNRKHFARIPNLKIVHYDSNMRLRL